MNRFSRGKEKYGIRSEISRDNYNEGTAARTRPFSFDEIMLTRKNKKLSGDVKAAAGAGNKLGEGIGEDVFDRFEPGRGHRYDKDYHASSVKHMAEDISKGSSKKQGDKTSIKDDSLVKGKDKVSHEIDTKLGKDMGSKAKNGMVDKLCHERRKDDERPSDNCKKEIEKNLSRNSLGKDKHTDISKGKSDRESKRKDRNREEDNYRERNAIKKHEFRKRQNSEYSDRKERKDSSQSHYEESRAKRRRSRSRGHEHKDRRSSPISSKEHKHTSYHGREHGDLALHPLKEKSGRKHSDVDRSRIPSNALSNHYRRNGGSKSGLGGYSPRKRRTEVGVKTPSPTARSPEKKRAGWDLPPAGKDNSFSGSLLSNLQSSDPTVSLYVPELASAGPINMSIVNSIIGVSANTLSMRKSTPSIDSVELTEATRSFRRLYVENLPASASEKEVMECFNSFLLSSGVTNIQGTQPCISCILHQEKGKALVEFLTPEDASAAISFDGRSFSGSILKIRRPKDFVEVTTGVPEKSRDPVDAICDIVNDSPHKIFIGGISKAISFEMIMEIASVFGSLRAFHFQVDEDLDEPCAFLEYVDQLVSPKACVGLNGMKLGGKVLTAVQATPDASVPETNGNLPVYRIPEHAKPLLEKPTEVLKLKNLFNPERLSLLSEPELEEVLEDVRLECSRFGTVKSVNIVKHSSCTANVEANAVTDHMGSSGTLQDLECDDININMDNLGEVADSETEVNSKAEVLRNVGYLIQENNAEDFENIDVGSADDCVKDVASKPYQIDYMAGGDSNSDVIVQEFSNPINNENYELELHDSSGTDIIQQNDYGLKSKLMAEKGLCSGEENVKLPDAFGGPDGSVGTNLDANEKVENKEQVCNIEQIFEPGCVFIEYGRTEVSCTAAHCLHGRLYDDRVISVQYIDVDIYRTRFPKGMCLDS